MRFARRLFLHRVRLVCCVALVALLLAVLSHCLAADAPIQRDRSLPDLALTPGVSVQIGVADLCARHWGKDVRHVTTAMKLQVFRSYGLTGNHDDSWCHLDAHGRRFEIDHLISRELGGADDTLNLWPQCYSGQWSAVMKDRVENRLHKEVCSGHLSLDEAQEQIRTDWKIPYRRFFGEPQ